jgi:glycerophosphoryl diester phosphodiesterase
LTDRGAAGGAWRQPGRTLVVAHRGATADAPENTLAAFRLAAEQGADAIEFDVRATSDGHLVIIHDPSLDRTTDRAGQIGALTLEEVRRADAGGRRGQPFVGERVPTLAEVLTVAHGQMLVDIELKVAGVEAQVIAELARAGMIDDALVTSFLEDVLVRVQAADPRPTVGLLQQWLDLERVAALGVEVYLPHVRALSPDVVQFCRGRGVGIIPWTARSEDDARAALALGVDGLIADDPLMVQRLIERHENHVHLRPRSGPDVMDKGGQDGA